MKLITNLKYNLRVYKFKKDYENRKKGEMEVEYKINLCEKSLYVIHRMDDEVRLMFYLPLFSSLEEEKRRRENNSKRIENMQKLVKEGIDIRRENEKRFRKESE